MLVPVFRYGGPVRTHKVKVERTLRNKQKEVKRHPQNRDIRTRVKDTPGGLTEVMTREGETACKKKTRKRTPL